MARQCEAFLFFIGLSVGLFSTIESSPAQGRQQTLLMQLTIESSPEASSPKEDGSVDFRCEVQDYEETVHVLTWHRFDPDTASWTQLAKGNTVEDSTDHRIRVTGVQGASSAADLGTTFQILTIKSVRASDESLYRCSVVEIVDGNATTCPAKIIASRELALQVHPQDVFPVCFPTSTDTNPLVLGDIVFCGTLNNNRVPVVTKRGNDGGELEAWSRGPRRDGRPGWELTKKVNATDDRVVYDCWSFPTDFSITGKMVLSCAITPRVAATGGTEQPPIPQGLSKGAIIAIAAAAGAVLIFLIIICVCCSYANK